MGDSQTTARASPRGQPGVGRPGLAGLAPDAQLNRRHECLSALHDTALGVINRLDVAEFLHATVVRAGRLLGTSHAQVFALDPATGEMDVRVATGTLTYFKGRPLRRGDGASGRAWETGRPVVVDDYDQWPGRLAGFPRGRLQSVAAVPLKSGPEVVGLLVFAHVQPGRSFGQDDLDLLVRFAHLASAALDNARLSAAMQHALAERKRAEELERDRNAVLKLVAKGRPVPDILRQIVVAVERQHAGVLCSILLLRQGCLHLGAAPSLPDEYIRAIDGQPIGPAAGSCGTAGYRGETVIVEDITTDPLWEQYRELGRRHGFRACWSVPILSGAGQVLGTFAMYAREPRHPGEADLATLEMARRLAGLAIEHRRLTDALAHQAHHDALTGLPNRVLYEDRVHQVVARARREKRLVALFMIDLDRFKRINDTLGHHIGDLVLMEVAQRFRACVRENDTLARWGGDTFAMILTDLEAAAGAAQIAERVLDVLRAPIIVDEHELFVTASIGIAIYPADGRDPGELLRLADNARSRAEEQGRNTYEFFTPAVGVAASERLMIENQLRRALTRGELQVYYQPQVVLRTGRLAGVEALLRWNHPERGLLPAGTFLAVAEESGLIVPIGIWLLEEACRQTRSWQRAGYSSLNVAVNVSAVQFRRPDFIEAVVRALQRADLAAGCLELELMESVMLRDVDAAARQIDACRSLGVRIALDDFGTGYSSLSYLHRLRIDNLKVGLPFIQGIEKEESSRRLVRAIIAVARSLGIRVTAEGVETAQQLQVLRRLGCERAQGYLLAQPLPASAFEAFLKRARL